MEIEVVAALLWKKDRFLICQRPPNKARPLLWEFAGGKVESGETKQQALVRECREELGIQVKVEKLFMEVVHAYPDVKVDLSLFDAKIVQGTPRLLEHQDMRWIQVDDIPQYNFCPADEKILKKLKELHAG